MPPSGQPNRGIMYWFSVLSVSVLTAVPLGLATPLSPRWDDMREKHSWGSVPEKWECQGQPPIGTTIDLRIALRPKTGSALTDALYEVSDPTHPRCVSIQLLLYAPHMYIRCVTVMVHTCQRNKSQSLSLLIRTHSTSSVPGLHITMFHPIWSRSRLVEVG